MATYNARKLTIVKGEDTYIIDPMQGDGAIYNDLTVTIPLSGWSASAPYTYVYTNSHILLNTAVHIWFRDGVRGGLVGDLKFTKTTGQVTFITNEPPVGDIPLTIRLLDSEVNGTFPVDATMIETDAIVGETNVQGALEDLDTRVASKVDKSSAISSITRNALVFTATRADGTTFTFDQQDNNTTYSLSGLGGAPKTEAIKAISRSGTTFTATRCDGTTFTFNQQDNNATYANATQSAAGLMSAADKTKLDGIATSANNYSHPNAAGNTGSFGPSANASPAHGGTFSVPYLTVNANGHVTACSTKTITLPADANTWRGYKSINYTYAYTIAASTNIDVTGNNLGKTSPSGYFPVAIRFFNSGTKNAVIYSVNSAGTGTDVVMRIKNLTSSSITGTCSLTIAFLQS